MKKIFIACWLLACTGLSTHGGETTFTDILTRVSRRDPITKAILRVDQHHNFRLEIKGKQAKVTIWKHMKVRDPNEETYTFPLSDVLRQEHARLVFQKELNGLVAACLESEQHFRISQYKKHPVHAGMPYLQAKELLKNTFRPDGLPRAEFGAHRLESDTHSMVFRHGGLVDIIAKENADQADAGDGN